MLKLLRRIPWGPTTLTLLVLVSAAVSVQPIRDAATGADVAEAFLDRPLSYVAMAPLSNVLDMLTLLSAAQHIGLLAALAVVFAVWRVAARSGRRGHLGAAGLFFGVVFAFYAASAWLPRPMASLATPYFADVVRVDFHSHTDASHDGKQTAEQLREWHGKAGYDVAFVTDHRSVAAVERAMLDNPVPVGAGVTLLQSIEVTWDGEHVSVPGAERAVKGLFNQTLSDVDTQALRIASFATGREPIVIWHHPRTMDRLKPVTDSQPVGIRAIEIVNGAPRDRDKIMQNRAAIVALAQGNELPLTAGSDNHGVGYAAPGWALMAIAGWRAATPEGIALAIDRVLRKDGFAATRVVERRVADTRGSAGAAAMTLFTAPVVMFRTLSFDERVSWIVWTWAAWALALAIRRRRAGATHAGPAA